MKKRILSMIITVIMCLNVLSVTAFATETNGGTYNIWIGGVQITDDNASDVLGDGTVSYDIESNILTLSDANITSGYEFNTGCNAGIYSEDELSITLNGTKSTVKALDATQRSFGIYVDGSLYISGSGSLIVNAGEVLAENNYADSVGIFTVGQLSISEVLVTASGGRSIANNDYVAYSNGVYTEGGLDISFDGSLIATGGEAGGGYSYSTGVEGYGYGDNYINISVYDGYLEAAGGKSTGLYRAGSNGIFLENGGFYTCDKTAKVILESDISQVMGGLVMSASQEDASDDVAQYAFSNGVCVYGGDVGIDAGEIVITSDNYSGVEGNAHAIFVVAREELGDNDEVIADIGGYVNINCDDVVVSEYGPYLLGTRVKITAPYGVAIFAHKGLEVSDVLLISKPEGGQIEGIGGVMEPENYVEPEYWTITDGSGNEAQSVMIEPLSYKVSIKGLSFSMAANVPVGKSMNDTYCEMHEVDDFSEVLDREREGYTLAGWYTDENCTEGNEFDFSTPITADITIYAKWVADVVEEPDYVAVVEKNEEGTVTVNPETVKSGETVVITIVPNEGKIVDTITVTDASGNSVTTSKNDNGTYSFVQPNDNVTVKVTYKNQQQNPASGDNKPSEPLSPDTGDSNNMVLFMVLLVSCGMAITGVFCDRKKKAF